MIFIPSALNNFHIADDRYSHGLLIVDYFPRSLIAPKEPNEDIAIKDYHRSS